MRKILSVALGCAVTFAAPIAHAQYIRSGFANTAAPRGDDNLAPSALGFNVNYFGVLTTTAVVCMNGYVIMGDFAPASPCAFPGNLSADPPAAPNLTNLRTFYGSVIAPFFSDIATNFDGDPGGLLQLGTGSLNGASLWAATWDGVRGYQGGSGTTGSTSTFQLVFASLGASDFIMEFNYGALGWAAEGGRGFTDDGGATGTAFLRTLTPTQPTNSRYCARFVGGLVTAEGTNTGCLTSIFTPLATVPEPSTIVLMASGLLAVIAVGNRRRRGES